MTNAGLSPVCRIEVFDPPAGGGCVHRCACGGAGDEADRRFAEDLEWFRLQGVAVARHDLGLESVVFTGNEVVRGALREDRACLPLTLVDGRIISRGARPSRGVIAASICMSLLGRGKVARILLPAVAELARRHLGEGGEDASSCCSRCRSPDD